MAEAITSPSTGHRLFDVGTKLAGLVLLVAAQEIGIASIAGITLAIAGVAVGVCTVFFGSEQS